MRAGGAAGPLNAYDEYAGMMLLNCFSDCVDWVTVPDDFLDEYAAPGMNAIILNADDSGVEGCGYFCRGTHVYQDERAGEFFGE